MDTEGVIKYELQFSPGPTPPRGLVAELMAWSHILWRLGLVGQDSGRYDGLAYGNLSRRLPDDRGGGFVITGSQTSGREWLTPECFATVTASSPEDNRLWAEGPIKPSSEALTHAVLYRLDPGIGYVFHVHTPVMWERAEALGLPVTAPDAAYGTPAMANEVERLVRSAGSKAPIIAMGGHRDGVIAWGSAAQDAGCALVSALARGLSLPQS